MTKGPTPRQAARAENLSRIKELALEQLAESGATDLSLRAIARELNLVSSALYRYFASRDELLTALIVDAYDDLADALEHAGSRARTPRRRWTQTSLAFRDWAVDQPHRFALIYGSAIPGYRAPETTIEPAGRVLLALIEPAAAHTSVTPAPVPRTLAGQLDAVVTTLQLDVDRHTMLALVGMFSRLVGLVTLELNGHFVGGFEPADTLFTELVEREADALGL